MPWPTKKDYKMKRNKGKRRKRELRIKKQSHRRGSKKAGHGWASRQAARRK